MATNSLATNINQAVSDFHSIKNAIIAKGVSVPTGTPTSDYASKIGQISGGGSSPVQSVDELPVASAENVNNLYYLTTDENIYKCIGTKQTFVVGQTIDSDIIFDTTQNPEDYVVTSTGDNSNAFLIGLGENEEPKYVIWCLDMFSQNNVEEYGKCYVLCMQEWENSDIDINNIYYINCDTITIEQFNEIISAQYGFTIDHFGWQKNVISKEQVNGLLIINGSQNPTNIAYYETYAMIQENPTSGTYSITENGTYDITNYENVDVNVQGDVPSGTLDITSNGTYDVTQYASANVSVSDMLQTRINNTKSCVYLFYNDTESDLSYLSSLDTSNVKDMSYMFTYCSKLTAIPAFNTSNVTNMTRMFQYCSSLTTIPAFDTSSVTNMTRMFDSCYKLTTIPAFDTSNVTNMSYMFVRCYKLTAIPAFDTSNVTNMSYMFNDCQSLTTTPLFNTSNVTSMNNMFTYCSKLTTIPAFDTSSVTNMTRMFDSCYKLTTIPAFDTSNVTNMSYMFQSCSSLTTIPAFDTSNVTDMSSMFSGCSSLEEIHMTGMKVSFFISASTKFTREALVEILGNLATVTSTKTLTMGSTNLAKLTDDDKAIATNKGWTLA